MTGPELLASWRADRGLKLAEAAELVGCSASALCEYEQGNKTPRLHLALRISEVTEGAVPVESWPDRRAAREASA